MSEFSNNLKALRIKRGLTQQKLANSLNVSQNAIYNWENGKREPNIETIEKISKVLEVTEQELLGYNDKEYMLYNAYRDAEPDERQKSTVIGGILITDKNLLRHFHKLNDYGKKAAIERVSELKYVPKYTKSDDLPFIEDIDLPFN